VTCAHSDSAKLRPGTQASIGYAPVVTARWSLCSRQLSSTMATPTVIDVAARK